jgi:serine/threonine-protein kinase
MGALRSGEMLAGTSYRVVREIGAGGMGVVYEIEHVRLKKHYVAKVIHEQISEQEGASKRIEREAQVLAGIRHPNVVQVHDVGTTPEGLNYFVMEKLDGVDLRTMAKRGPLPHLRAIEIVIDVVDALDHVHKGGVVHRDIKPENIFLSEEPHGTMTKLLDFGVVHIFESDGRLSERRLTKTGGFVGTIHYAAPEQMQGTPAAPPTDIYAAGLVLFELLAGRGPFDDDPGVGLTRCFKPAPLLTDLAPEAPRAVADVLVRVLAQDPAKRPTASALVTELRAIHEQLKRAPSETKAPSTDDALRAEIDELLRHMPPPDLEPRVPSSRRPSTSPTAFSETLLPGESAPSSRRAWGPIAASAMLLLAAMTACGWLLLR